MSSRVTLDAVSASAVQRNPIRQSGSDCPGIAGKNEGINFVEVLERSLADLEEIVSRVPAQLRLRTLD